MKHCKNCNRLIRSEAQFCEYCGAPNKSGAAIEPGEEPEELKGQLLTFFTLLDNYYPDGVIDVSSWNRSALDAPAYRLRRALGYNKIRTFLEAYGYSFVPGKKVTASAPPETEESVICPEEDAGPVYALEQADAEPSDEKLHNRLLDRMEEPAPAEELHPAGEAGTSIPNSEFSIPDSDSAPVSAKKKKSGLGWAVVFLVLVILAAAVMGALKFAPDRVAAATDAAKDFFRTTVSTVESWFRGEKTAEPAASEFPPELEWARAETEEMLLRSVEETYAENYRLRDKEFLGYFKLTNPAPGQDFKSAIVAIYRVYVAVTEEDGTEGYAEYYFTGTFKDPDAPEHPQGEGPYYRYGIPYNGDLIFFYGFDSLHSLELELRETFGEDLVIEVAK